MEAVLRDACLCSAELSLVGSQAPRIQSVVGSSLSWLSIEAVSFELTVNRCRI